MNQAGPGSGSRSAAQRSAPQAKKSACCSACTASCVERRVVERRQVPEARGWHAQSGSATSGCASIRSRVRPHREDGAQERAVRPSTSEQRAEVADQQVLGHVRRERAVLPRCRAARGSAARSTTTPVANERPAAGRAGAPCRRSRAPQRRRRGRRAGRRRSGAAGSISFHAPRTRVAGDDVTRRGTVPRGALVALVAGRARPRRGAARSRTPSRPHSRAARGITSLWWNMLIGSALAFGDRRPHPRSSHGCGETGRACPGVARRRPGGARASSLGFGLVGPDPRAVRALPLLGHLPDPRHDAADRAAAAAEQPKLTVRVIGHQFWWEVRYPGTTCGDRERDPHSRAHARRGARPHRRRHPQLLGAGAEPEDRHGPGADEPRRCSTRTRPGRYRGQCAEFCGLQHAHMGFYVFADPPAAFRALARAPSRSPRGAPSYAPVRDRVRRAATRSAARARRATSAPTSRTSRSRTSLAALDDPEHAGALAQWIARPAARQARQPDAGARSSATRELAQLVAYLESAPIAVTAPAPAQRARRAARAHLGERPGVLGWLTTTDHKRIGLLYFWTTLVFFGAGGVEALLMRTQLAQPNSTVARPEHLRPAVHDARDDDDLLVHHPDDDRRVRELPDAADARRARHGVPAPERAELLDLPRVGHLPLRRALPRLRRRTPAGSTTCRSRRRLYDPGRNIEFYSLGLLFNAIASTLTAANFIVTIFKCRAPGMSFNRMPLFCFAFLAASFGLLFALPSLSVDLIYLFLDRNVGTHFFDPAHGGSTLLWQHLFWFFGHPEVYILIVPAFGIATEIIPAFTQRQDDRVPARRDRRAARRLHRLRRVGAPHVRDRASRR